MCRFLPSNKFYISKFLDTGILFIKFKVCDILSKVVHVHSLQKLTEQLSKFNLKISIQNKNYHYEYLNIMYEVKIKVLPERRSFREYKLQLGI